MPQLELPDTPNALFFTCSEHGRQKLDYCLGGDHPDIALKCGCLFGYTYKHGFAFKGKISSEWKKNAETAMAQIILNSQKGK